MKIYLADLFHVFNAERNPDTNPYTIPLGIGFLASTLKHRLPGHTVRLFRDPNKLLAACRDEAPDMVGFSICSWNSDLTHRVAGAIKGDNPDVVIVGGGPSIDDSDDQLVEFLGEYRAFNYLVPNEGESGLMALVSRLANGEPGDTSIPGVAYLAPSGQLMRGRYDKPIVPDAPMDVKRIAIRKASDAEEEHKPHYWDVEIPSPYLDGTLDEFLADGLVPIIQTMRGCPYHCHFCVSGADEWNTPRGFSLERVKAEIDYVLSRGGAKDLILTDENWGLLGERDVEIARYIMDRHHREGTPSRLYYYTAKIVTPASREIVSLVAPIAWIAEFSMSFQSLNPDTRKAIKRTNISMEKLVSNVQWARERKILTSSEMIYGFPHETPKTFFEGIEELTRHGMDRVTIYPLQLFSGIDLASRKAREEYGFRTKYRLSDCGYGVYDNGNIVAAETEEIVVGTRWSSSEDYFTVRKYGLFQQFVYGRAYFVELAQLCAEAKIEVAPFVGHLAFMDYEQYPGLRAVFEKYRLEAEQELKSTRNEVFDRIADDLKNRRSPDAVKLNLIYLAMILSDVVVTRELLDITRRYFKSVSADPTALATISAYIEEVLPNRLVPLGRASGQDVVFSTRFDYGRWDSGDFSSIDELLREQPHECVALTPGELKSNLSKFDPTDRSSLQWIFDNTPKRHLMRKVVPS